MISLLALVAVNVAMVIVLVATQSDKLIESRTDREEKILKEYLKEKE